MNRFTFFSTTFALKHLYLFSKAKTTISGAENIPDGSVVFTINHFTRIETLFLPYHLEKITGKPICSLAHHSLFSGALGSFLEKAGGVSTTALDRDRLVLKSLLTGEAHWVVFPEGRMVKSKKVMAKDAFIVDSDEGRDRPRTGAANWALRAEFYRQRIQNRMTQGNLESAMEVCRTFDIEDPAEVTDKPIYIVPVNITYYPLRTRENALTRLASFLVDTVSERVNEELMTEGSMLFDGVDVDIRFGRPLEVARYLQNPDIGIDIENPAAFGPDDAIPSIEILRSSALRLMRDYMAAIYSMTTVNPDHLFATILREMPQNIIAMEDLQRRVYLAAALRLDSQRLYLHSSLADSQIHLITDDSFGRCADFFQYAEETDVLVPMENGKLQRNEAKFKDDYHFHDIRLTNPIAVMANEIEPLTLLRPHLFRLARETDLHVKRRLVAYLLERGARTFKEARIRYGTALCLTDRDAGQPFLLEGQEGKMGILLIHGYLGCPGQMRSLGETLQKEGFWVYGMRLPGHGTSPEELEKSKVAQWENTVLEGYALLHTLCGNVAVAGVSLGGLLACILAVRIPKLAALCLVGMPFKIEEYNFCADSGDALWDRIFSRIRVGKKKKLRLACTGENFGMGYDEHPETAFREMALLMEKARTQLALIQVPCMVLQSREDPLVFPGAALEIFESLKTPHKELHLMDGATHHILSAAGAARVQRIVNDFFALWEKGSAHRPEKDLLVEPDLSVDPEGEKVVSPGRDSENQSKA